MCLNVVQCGGPSIVVLVQLCVLSTYMKALVGIGDVVMCKTDNVCSYGAYNLRVKSNF